MRRKSLVRAIDFCLYATAVVVMAAHTCLLYLLTFSAPFGPLAVMAYFFAVLQPALTSLHTGDLRLADHVHERRDCTVRPDQSET